MNIREGLDPPKAGRECVRLETTSALLYLLLKRYDEFIVRAPIRVQLRFLRGLWLGDGHKGGDRFYNTDPRLIAVVEKLLELHGIKHSKHGPYKLSRSALGYKPIYYVYIRQKSKERFLKLTGLAESPPRPLSNQNKTFY